MISAGVTLETNKANGRISAGRSLPLPSADVAFSLASADTTYLLCAASGSKGIVVSGYALRIPRMHYSFARPYSPAVAFRARGPLAIAGPFLRRTFNPFGSASTTRCAVFRTGMRRLVANAVSG